jgi:hypothetical protein
VAPTAQRTSELRANYIKLPAPHMAQPHLKRSHGALGRWPSAAAEALGAVPSALRQEKETERGIHDPDRVLALGAGGLQQSLRTVQGSWFSTVRGMTPVSQTFVQTQGRKKGDIRAPKPGEIGSRVPKAPMDSALLLLSHHSSPSFLSGMLLGPNGRFLTCRYHIRRECTVTDEAPV